MSTANYPSNPPPGYTDGPADPLLAPTNASSGGPSEGPRSDMDHIPDDFKFGNFVSECVISIRQAFIRKVYTIFSLQILATIAVSAFICLNDSVSKWTLQNSWAMIVSMVGSFAFMILAYVKSRSYPINLVFLAGFTLSEAYMIGFISSLYETRIVLQAFFITFVVFTGLTIFALQTKYELIGWQKYATGALFLLIGMGFVMIFLPYSSAAEIAYSGIGALVFSVFILVDTQLIQQRFHPEEEVPAAISLYLDIINLFLNILRLLQASNDN